MLKIDTPLDMHLHLRDDKMLDLVAPLSSKYFAGALIMPNIIPPITTKQHLIKYKNKIISLTKHDNFTPYMTLFYQNYDYDFLYNIKNEILAIKLYPDGVTTNSNGGINNFDIDILKPTLQAMSELNIPLSIHGETNGFIIDREKEFLPIYENIAKNFPNLKIIMEHITTQEATKLLSKYDNLYATITLHHLCITLDDVIGGMLQPHLFCKPIAKTPQDKKALLQLALSGNEKIMFGSDSAPHPRSKKETNQCAAGIFSAPIALQMLATIFDKHNALDNLQAFVSDNAKKIYNINPPKKEIFLKRKSFVIPNQYSKNGIEVVPFMANTTIDFT